MLVVCTNCCGDISYFLIFIAMMIFHCITHTKTSDWAIVYFTARASTFLITVGYNEDKYSSPLNCNHGLWKGKLNNLMCATQKVSILVFKLLHNLNKTPPFVWCNVGVAGITDLMSCGFLFLLICQTWGAHLSECNSALWNVVMLSVSHLESCLRLLSTLAQVSKEGLYF